MSNDLSAEDWLKVVVCCTYAARLLQLLAHALPAVQEVSRKLWLSLDCFADSKQQHQAAVDLQVDCRIAAP